VAAIIVAAILLRVFSANPHNTVVSDIHDAGAWLAGPFKNIFSVGSAMGSMALNWGIAAVVYLAAAHILAGLIMRTPRREPSGAEGPARAGPSKTARLLT
jgi:hypothetical protein